jgi:hypothetical protein
MVDHTCLVLSPLSEHFHDFLKTYRPTLYGVRKTLRVRVEKQKLGPMAKKGGETVMVVVRMRPFNTKEKNEGRGPCIELDPKTGLVSDKLIQNCTVVTHTFFFPFVCVWSLFPFCHTVFLSMFTYH